MRKFTALLIAAFVLFFAVDPSYAATLSFSSLTSAQKGRLNRIGAPSAISDAEQTRIGDLLGELVGTDRYLTDTADSAATNYGQNMIVTTPADTTGTNSHIAYNVSFTIGNATGGTNSAIGWNLANVTGDAQVNVTGIKIGTGTTLGTSYAIQIGSGWDAGLVASSPVDVSGTVLRVQVSTVAGLTACAAGTQGAVVLVTDASGATDCTSGSGSTKNLCVCDGSAYVNVA